MSNHKDFISLEEWKADWLKRRKPLEDSLFSKWKGISYLAEGEEEWSDERLADWKKKWCSQDIHVLDEVLSISPYHHYLYCDACGCEKPVE